MNTTNTMNKFEGSTADDMNWKARWGLVVEQDLQEWARQQNKLLCSIEWYVVKRTMPVREDFYIEYPMLITRELP